MLAKSVQDPFLEVFKTHSKIPIPEQAGEGATSKFGFSGSGSALQQVSVHRKDAAPWREKHLYKHRIHSVRVVQEIILRNLNPLIVAAFPHMGTETC